jgi:hypothetical protein
MNTQVKPTAFVRTAAEERDVYLQERYRLVREDLGPFKLPQGPKLVVHLVPGRDQWPTTSVGGVKRIPEQGMVPYLESVSGGSARMTFDGRAFYLADGDAASTVTHILHNGVVEAVMGLLYEHAPPEYKGISLRRIEESALRFVSGAVDNGLVERTVGFPLIVRLALLDTPSIPATPNGETSPRVMVGLPVRQMSPVLVLPDVVVLNDEQAVEYILPVAFDRMWQAWGYLGTANYAEDGGGLWRKARFQAS